MKPFTTLRYEGLGGLRALAERVDGVEKVPLRYPCKGVERSTDRYCGLMNTRSGELTAAVSKDYGTLTHGEVIHLMANKLEGRHLNNVHGVINELSDGNVMKLGIFFDDLAPINDTKSNLTPGIVIRNPYGNSGGRRAFHGEGYYLRSICWNFGIVGNILPELDITEFHADTIFSKVSFELDSFIQKHIDGSVTVLRAIQTSQTRLITMQDSHEIAVALEIIGIAEKHADGIADKVKFGGEFPSYYDIYNGMTNYTSNTASLTGNVRERLESMAAKFINPTYTVPAMVGRTVLTQTPVALVA